MIPLVDAHAHLADTRLRDSLPKLLEDAETQHVTHICVNAARPDEWQDVVALSCRSHVYGALGLHPFFPEFRHPTLIDDLRKAFQTAPPSAKLVAVGEIGLDAWNGRENLAELSELFREQLLLAQELKLPVCLHNRKTWSDFFEILKQLNIKELHGYCHHFTGSPEVARKVLDLGLFISFCGPATHPNAHRIHEAIRYVPADRILTETDAPDLPPIQAQSAMSAPPHVRYVLQTIAELKQLPLEQLAEQVESNFEQCLLIKGCSDTCS